MLEMIAALGDAGGFQPDRAATGRHTKIMQRVEQIALEANDEPVGLLELCRLTGASRRSLTAIVLARTGNRQANICAGAGCGGRTRCCHARRWTPA